MRRSATSSRIRGARAIGVSLAGLIAVGVVTVVAQAQPAAAAHGSRARETLSAAAAQHGPARPSLAVGSGQVAIDRTRPSVVIAGPAGNASLALEGSASTAEEGNGLVGFADVAPSTGAAVRTGNGWAQVLTVLHGPEAVPVQRFRLGLPPGSHLVSRADGGFSVRSAAGAVIGDVAAPWARDATGQDLPTSYALEGDTLVQRTDTAGAAFPVVADPRLTFGWGVYLNMRGIEVRTAATAIVGVGGGAVAVGCTLISKLPNQVLRTIATLACGAGAVNLPKIWDAIVKIWRDTSIDNSACYQMKIIPRGSGFKKVSRSNCG
jgi:hypothetical protein